MKKIISFYLPIICISLLINLLLISLFIYSSYRIASTGIFALRYNLDVVNESDCRNYLRGRQFISDNGREIEFNYEGCAYVTYKGSIKTICAGHFKIEEVVHWSEEKSSDLDKRKIKIDNDITGWTSMRFELKKDGSFTENGNSSGTYYPIR